jgi:dihydroneopterin aldolase
VALQGCRFFAYHGFYPEEQRTGNHFVVDIETERPAYAADSDELENTVNYERLFDIASAEMKVTSKLLETVAHRILKSVLAEFPDLEIVKVSISKQNLPVQGEVKNSLVELTYSK